MTSSLFEERLEALNSQMKREGRNIALILDNCPAHPHIELQHINLIFLPPNTTAKTAYGQWDNQKFEAQSSHIISKRVSRSVGNIYHVQF